MDGHHEHPYRIWQGTSDWFHANSVVLNGTYGVVLSYMVSTDLEMVFSE